MCLWFFVLRQRNDADELRRTWKNWFDEKLEVGDDFLQERWALDRVKNRQGILEKFIILLEDFCFVFLFVFVFPNREFRRKSNEISTSQKEY